MTIAFTKIKWAGEDVILVTIREHAIEPVLILSKYDIENLNKSWKDVEDEIGTKRNTKD